MNGKHQQKGYACRVKNTWYGRWYVPELDENGKTVWVQHAETLCEFSHRYRSRKDVQSLLDDKLRPLNEGHAGPEGTLTIAQYGDVHFLPWAERELKPSTSAGYKKLWKRYLRPRVADITLRGCRCVHVTNLLAAIHREHGIGRLT